jgi:hypothetical protein
MTLGDKQKEVSYSPTFAFGALIQCRTHSNFDLRFIMGHWKLHINYLFRKIGSFILSSTELNTFIVLKVLLVYDFLVYSYTELLVIPRINLTDLFEINTFQN